MARSVEPGPPALTTNRAIHQEVVTSSRSANAGHSCSEGYERGSRIVRRDVLLGVPLHAALMTEGLARGAGHAQSRVGVSELIGAAEVGDDTVDGNFRLGRA